MLILVFSIGFVAIPNNPLVILQARLGLSPAPLERYLGVKSLFSGMTEGAHQLAHLNFRSAFEANIFSPLLITVIAIMIVFWRFPKIHTKTQEMSFFIFFVLASALVNIFN